MTWVQSLVGELRAHKPHGKAKKNKTQTKNNDLLFLTTQWVDQSQLGCSSAPGVKAEVQGVCLHSAGNSTEAAMFNTVSHLPRLLSMWSLIVCSLVELPYSMVAGF